MKISVVSGGFDPIHEGHVLYIDEAAKVGDKLVVALNSDQWLEKKKGKFFMNFSSRKKILESLENVDEVIDFDDDINGSCINALKKIKKKYPEDNIIFCNGGDRDASNIPEMELEGIEYRFCIGGDSKKNSSSELLKNWGIDKEIRQWGEFFVLHKDNITKVKELVVKPFKKLSLQRHFFRSELWFVKSGRCKVLLEDKKLKNNVEHQLKKFDILTIPKGRWHQLINESSNNCRIIEIEYGEKTDENDIERAYL